MRQKFKCTKCGLCCMNIQNVELAKDLDDGTGVDRTILSGIHAAF